MHNPSRRSVDADNSKDGIAIISEQVRDARGQGDHIPGTQLERSFLLPFQDRFQPALQHEQALHVRMPVQ
jgi:hypothetical protein